MSEAEAHRFIEKQAMDLRVTKREIASRILKTYENKFEKISEIFLKLLKNR